jgi:oxepin-CoA hydrolase/3-oxo-5,6-dehydrosuberyl-CoA semialdehyde dehydrogenase
MITIDNRKGLLEALRGLNPNVRPAFGIMTPHHMVEHLAFAVKFSNGKLPQRLYVPSERAETMKNFLLGEGEHPIGFKSPLLGDGLEPLLTTNLNTATDYLDKELTVFDTYFRENPDATFTHPLLGELTYSEWVLFHNKHFSHHFKQFNI